MRRVNHRLAAWILGMALAGCGGHSLDVGSTDGGVEATTDVNAFADADPNAPQVWRGHFANHRLADGSDALTMTLTFARDGTVTGTLLLGSGSVLQPPTDPNVGYPPGADFSGVTAIEGFPYTILDGKMTGSRLTFHVAEPEAWATWCALQTSYLVQAATDSGVGVPMPDFYGCLAPGKPGFGVGPTGCTLFDATTMKESPIDCGKWELCMGGACDCSAEGCSVSQRPTFDMPLELMIAGTTATGTASDESGSYPVHFTRTM